MVERISSAYNIEGSAHTKAKENNRQPCAHADISAHTENEVRERVTRKNETRASARQVNRRSNEREERPRRPSAGPTRLGDILREWKLNADTDDKPPS